MTELPTGTVTFLFTDIEGSTGLLRALGDRYPAVLERHNAIVREAASSHGGTVVSTEGDSFFVVFRDAGRALAAAADAQRALDPEPWPDGQTVRVRMGLHTGAGLIGGDNYVGLDVHRAARIASAGHGGQILLSDATRALVEQSLPDGVRLRDLGRHRLKGLPSAERVHQVLLGGMPDDTRTISSLDLRPNNLPASLTSFVGREDQVTEISERLGTARLLTLTGPGGTGKTRLSIRVAEELLPKFEHGCWFVELDVLRDAALVPATVASTLGVKVPPDSPPLAALESWLRDRQLLLVLDNFEQVSEAAQACPSLLAAAPGLRILVTSRTPLHVYGEQEYAVPPLASAAELRAGSQRGVEALSQYEAVRLFIERALAVKPEFRITNENAPAVAEICARLDGLPLAIELAAARVKLLTPAEMLRRLDQNLSLLASSSRDLPDRQRTLQGAIDWSHELLTEPEQRLFARLSVFRGGFGMLAAEAVCADEELGEDVFEGVASLVDHSLVHTDQAAAESRFAMLETIREYAREKLSSGPGAEPFFRRHAIYFFELAGRAGGQLTGPDQLHWLDELAREQDNLRAAFSRAPELGMLDDALTAAGSTWRYWQVRGQFDEGRQILERLLADAGADPAARALALTGAGGLAYWQMDYEVMGTYYVEARKLYEQLGDRPRLAEALYNESYLAMVTGGFQAGREALERAAALYQEVGDELGVANTDSSLSFMHYFDGDAEAAARRVENAAAIYRRLGAMWQLADTLTPVAYARGAIGQWPSAVAALHESIELFERMGNELGTAMAIEATGAAAAWVGQHELAARLFGKADEIRERLAAGPPLRLFLSERFRGRVVAAAGTDFERLHGEGAAMPTSEAVALARTFEPPPDAPPFPAGGPQAA